MGQTRFHFFGCNGPALAEEEIKSAIVVKISHGHAAAHDFRQVKAAAAAVEVNEIKARPGWFNWLESELLACIK